MTVRRAVARVNVAAIERNCARLRGELKDGAQLCVVVKADGYGHGAVMSARAALAGGASWLAVAGDGRPLRRVGGGWPSARRPPAQGPRRSALTWPIFEHV